MPTAREGRKGAGHRAQCARGSPRGPRRHTLRRGLWGALYYGVTVGRRRRPRSLCQSKRTGRLAPRAPGFQPQPLASGPAAASLQPSTRATTCHRAPAAAVVWPGHRSTAVLPALVARAAQKPHLRPESEGLPPPSVLVAGSGPGAGRASGGGTAAGLRSVFGAEATQPTPARPPPPGLQAPRTFRRPCSCS